MFCIYIITNSQSSKKPNEKFQDVSVLYYALFINLVYCMDADLDSFG